MPPARRIAYGNSGERRIILVVTSAQGALNVLLLHVCALVVVLLAFDDGHFQLYVGSGEVHGQRNDGQSLLLNRLPIPTGFPALDQQSARSQGIVILPVAVLIRRDVKIHENELITVLTGKGGIAILEVGLSGTERLHLGAGQDDSGLERLQHGVIVRRFLVRGYRTLYSIRRWLHFLLVVIVQFTAIRTRVWSGFSFHGLQHRPHKPRLHRIFAFHSFETHHV